MVQVSKTDKRHAFNKKWYENRENGLTCLQWFSREDEIKYLSKMESKTFVVFKEQKWKHKTRLFRSMGKDWK